MKKTNKGLSKKIRQTSTGKIMRRKMGQGHFRAGKSGKRIQRKRKATKFNSTDAKNILLYLSRSRKYGKNKRKTSH